MNFQAIRTKLGTSRASTLLEVVTATLVVSLLMLISIPQLSQARPAIKRDAQLIAHCIATLQHLANVTNSDIGLSVDTKNSKLALFSERSALRLLPLQQLCQPGPRTRFDSAMFATASASHTATFYTYGLTTPGKIVLTDKSRIKCTITTPLYGTPNVSCK